MATKGKRVRANMKKRQEEVEKMRALTEKHRKFPGAEAVHRIKKRLLLVFGEPPAELALERLKGSLVPRPAPSFPSLAVRLIGRGPGTFPHVSDVTDRTNYANMGVM